MRHFVTEGPARAAGWFLALCAAMLMGGCGRHQSISPAKETGELADQEITDFALTETDEGRPQWKLNARYAATYNSRNLVIARTVRVDFYDEDGKRSSVLTAREGDLNQRTHNMTARGQVVLQTAAGTRLSTEELRFLNREQKIVVPIEQLVRVEHSGNVLTGYGFESDPDLAHYEFKKDVQATVHTQSGGTIGNTRDRP
jgi:LPS export ABC transporter protein LptC